MRKGCDRGGCSCGHEDVMVVMRMVKCGDVMCGGVVVLVIVVVEVTCGAGDRR